MARIVVLDDQPDICLSIQHCLTHVGHTVQIAHTGDEAIDFAYLFEPDILITDWNLHSDYDGLEVAEAFHAANNEIKTILISGYICDALDKQLSDTEIFQSLRKPFSMDKLVSIVDDAINLGVNSPFSLN